MMIDILLMCVLVILWDILDSDVSLHHTECFVNVMKFMKLKWIIYENVKKMKWSCFSHSPFFPFSLFSLLTHSGKLKDFF